VLVAIALLVPTIAWAATGDLLWQAQVDIGNDFGTAVVAHGGRVFVAGFSQSATDVNFVRAHAAATGTLLWQHLSPKSDSEDVRLAAHGRLLFMASANIVRAHDARSGAVVWEDDTPALWRVIAAGHGLAVVVGYRSSPATGIDVVVRALDAETGGLLWEDQTDAGGDDFAFAAAIDGGRIFVAGLVERIVAPRPLALVRAYARRTGALLWQRLADAASEAFAIATHANLVLVAGESIIGGETRGLVQAYDARTGTLMWEHVEPVHPLRIGFYTELVVHGGRLFAAGTNGSFLVQALDLHTGDVVWSSEVEGDGQALTITEARGDVFAAGWGDAGWLVRALDGRTGETLSEDGFDTTGLVGIARDDGVEGRRLYVAGEASTPAHLADVFLRAYDLRGGKR
jgi:outer membrane protein assembly factor BamB